MYNLPGYNLPGRSALSTKPSVMTFPEDGPATSGVPGESAWKARLDEFGLLVIAEYMPK